MEIKLRDNDFNGKLNGDQLLIAERVAVARSGNAIRINDMI